MHTFLGSLRRLLVCALAFASTASLALAQTPGRPIVLVHPFAPGSPAEVVGRWMIPGLTERLKSAVVLENRSGAGGQIGVTSVINSAPDGNTVLFSSNGVTIDQAVKLKPAYDPLKELRPITRVMYGALAIHINPQVPANTLGELIAYAKANPGKLNYSHAGVGTFTHMAVELFKYSAGINMVDVPYRGGAEMASSTISNFTQLHMLPPSNTIEFVKSGKLKMLAVGAPKRLSMVPDVPTVSEAGVPGYEALAWYGLFVTAATPNEVFDRLERAFLGVLNEPDIIQKIQSIGFVPVGNKSDEFRRQLEAEIRLWKEVVAKAGIPRN
jgi:tripartite-type tricarboxylate transporter receptor subunit TctC